MTLAVTGEAIYDDVVRDNPLGLLLAMILDQQISIELAFRGPARLRDRLGELTVDRIVEMDIGDLVAVFSEKPALHRFPKAMAKRMHELCRHIADEYGGVPDRVWIDARTADDLESRLIGLPGFGAEKVMILTAVLGKRLGVAPTGWQAVAGPFADDEPRSVADIDSPQALERVKAWKKLQRAAGKSKQQ